MNSFSVHVPAGYIVAGQRWPSSANVPGKATLGCCATTCVNGGGQGFDASDLSGQPLLNGTFFFFLASYFSSSALSRLF